MPTAKSFAKLLDTYTPPPDEHTGDLIWEEDPLPLDEFVRHPDHLSNGIPDSLFLFPEQLVDMEAFLGVDPKQIFEAEREIQFTQAFILWGKGGGKDLTVAITQAWITHILLCLRDPQSYLGLPAGEPIDNMVIAYNQTQSRTVYFTKYKYRLKHWPWLRRRINTIERDPGASDRYLKDGGGFMGADSVILPHGIRCWALPATPDSGEGKNVLFWILDELSAFSSPTRLNQAQKIHNMVVSSATSRFGNRWRGFAISFPRHRGDYMMQMHDQVVAGLLPDCYTALRATWEVNPKTKRSDFDDHYRRNPEDAAMRYECKPPAAVDAYFRSPHLIVSHATGIPESEIRRYQDTLGWAEETVQFFAQRGSNPITALDENGDPKLDHRGFPQLARWFRARKRPDGSPISYYAHVDPGKSGDAFGFALAHLEHTDLGEVPKIDLAFRWTGRMFKDFGPIKRDPWFADTLTQEELVTAAEVDFRTVREFLFYLTKARGFSIEMFSADTWNSVESLQAISYRGIPVSNHVVSKVDYDELKDLIYSRQLIYYGWPVLIHELEKLELHNGTRVDAPRTAEGETIDSHKDVADAVAACVWRMCRMRGEGLQFATLAPLDPVLDAFDKAGGQVDIAMDPEQVKAMQAAAFQAFMDGADRY
jgi:hypothetical protein